MRYLLCLVLLIGTACHDDYMVPSGGDADPGRVDAILALTGDATAGESVFTDHCAGCHDPAGAEDRVGPALAAPVSADPAADVIEVILAGVGAMPAQNLEDQETADVYAWMVSAFTAGNDAPDGAALYAERCAACHQVDGGAGPVGPGMAAVVPGRTAEQLRATIADGVPPSMPAFDASLDAAEIDAIVDWLVATFGG